MFYILQLKAETRKCMSLAKQFATSVMKDSRLLVSQKLFAEKEIGQDPHYVKVRVLFLKSVILLVF